MESRFFSLLALCAGIYLPVIFGITSPVEAGRYGSMLSQACTSNSSCNEVYETCVSNQCECNTYTTARDNAYDLCKIKAGRLCGCHVYHTTCVENAICAPMNRRPNRTNHVLSCTCLDTFFKNPDGFCVHKFNEPCMTNDDCDNGLKCGRGGICKCTFSDQKFHFKTEKCYGVYGGSCKDNVWDDCESNFVCAEVSKQGYQCTCPKGLSLTLSGDKCEKGYGKKCEYLSAGATPCDSSRLLFCHDSVCQCRHPFQEYDPIKMRCIGMENSHCNISTRDIDNYCVEGTTCRTVWGSSSIGECQRVDHVVFSLQKMASIIVIITGFATLTILGFWKLRKYRVSVDPIHAANPCQELTPATSAEGIMMERQQDEGENVKEKGYTQVDNLYEET